MKNFKLFTCITFLSTQFLFAQFVPNEPAQWEAFPQTPEISVTSNNDEFPIDLAVLGATYHLRTGQCRQIRIRNINPSYTLHLRLQHADANTRVYIRLLNSGGYLGPYRVEHFSDVGFLESGVIFENLVSVEIYSPAKIADFPSLKIEKLNPYNLEKPSHIQNDKRMYWSSPREKPVLLLTGYWPPTNEIIRHFSQNPDLNPTGWQGEDWENRGYDIVSFFPEFNPPDCSNCGMGSGDLEVDYQDTSEDFWAIVEETRPIGIITFSRGYIDLSWEIEWNLVNRTNWINDYQNPFYPTPNPPDQESDPYYERHSSLPTENIITAITESDLGLNPYVDWNGDGGHFLSEFIGFHGVWYKDLFTWDTENPCHSAGHIHVGGNVDWDTGRLAAEATIRELLNYLDEFQYTPGDVNEDEEINVLDIVTMVNFILNLSEPSNGQFYAGDVNQDGTINVLDVITIINWIMED